MMAQQKPQPSYPAVQSQSQGKYQYHPHYQHQFETPDNLKELEQKTLFAANQIKLIDLTPNVIQNTQLEEHFANQLTSQIMQMAANGTLQYDFLKSMICKSTVDFKKNLVLGYVQHHTENGTNS